MVRRVTERRTRRPVLTWADRLTLYALLGLGVGFLLVPPGSGAATGVAITGRGGFTVEAAIAEEGTYEVPGPLGATAVVVRDGAAAVESSPCPHQMCVSMGAVASPGQVIVCVPNGVVVRVLGRGGALDATTR